VYEIVELVGSIIGIRTAGVCRRTRGSVEGDTGRATAGQNGGGCGDGEATPANLIAQGRDKLCEQVGEITGAKVLGLFTDIDVQLGERVFVFTMDRELTNGNR
jgi:hypothetical protein